MTLPESLEPGDTGHRANHRALRAEYDSRHPDEPLPELIDELTLHQLLHVDAGLEGPPPSELWGGHTAHHNALHAAYNARTTQVGEPWSTA